MKPSTTHDDVLILGGGLAGLVAAHALADAGLRVTVVEASGHLGGRAQSIDDPESGQRLDLGPHIFLESYPNLLAWLDALGTRDRIAWQSEPHLVVYHGEERTEQRIGRLPPPLTAVSAALSQSDTRLLDLVKSAPAVAAMVAATEEDVAALDPWPAGAVLEALGASPEVQRALWSFPVRAILNVSLEECSAGALFRVGRFFLGAEPARFGFPKSGLGDVFLPEARQALERLGASVRLETPVAALELDNDRVVGVRTVAGDALRATTVVAAVPPQALRRVLPASLAQARSLRRLDAFVPSPYVCWYAWFDRKITEERFWARSFRAADLATDFYDLSNIRPALAEGSSLVTANVIYSHRANALSDDELGERLLAELRENLPAARDARLRRQVIHRVPMAIPCPYPGTERLRPPARSGVEGLVLAGDWTATGLPCSMESAARSGYLAADTILCARDPDHRPLAIPPPDVAPTARALRAVLNRLPRHPLTHALDRLRAAG